MKARDIIEAEDPKSVFQQAKASPHPFTPRRLTPNEQERLVNILAYGPIAKEPIDDRFLDWGYIEWYDDGQHDAVDAKPGFVAAFYSHPEIKGAIGREWLDMPSIGKGWPPRKFHWGSKQEAQEDPKSFLSKVAKRYGPDSMFTVRSSHGEFSIQPDGKVVRWQPFEPDDEDAIAMEKIVKFDLDEWRTYWNWVGDLPGGFDILDLGYWLKDDMYEPPENDWREELKAMAVRGDPNLPAQVQEEGLDFTPPGSPGIADGTASKAASLVGAIPTAATILENI